MTESSSRPYLPAAGKHWRLPFYDLIAKVFGADAARVALAEQVSPKPGDRVLEIGCGTGSLLLLLARMQPAVEAVGLDPDPGALALARRKAEKAGVAIELDQGYADALPYPDASFDAVASSFMFHHLPRDAKPAALREARRVLKPGGRFHMADFAGPESLARGFLAHLIHPDKHLADNAEARVLAFLRDAGFAGARVVQRRTTRLGGIVYYQASAPE